MYKRLNTAACLFATILIGVNASVAWANPNRTKFKQMVVFGDSLVDTGNVFTATGGFPPPPVGYDNGRFTNGDVWVETLADALNADSIDNKIDPPTPFLLGGSNFAFGGTNTGSGVTPPMPPDDPGGSPNLSTQVGIYLSTLGPELTVPDPSKTLFVLSAGSNDFLRSVQANASAPAESIAQDIVTLAAFGARHFLVPNLARLGQTPASQGTADLHPFRGVFAPVTLGALTSDQLDGLATTFNDALDDQLDALETVALPSLGLNQVEINRLDVKGIFDAILANPAGFGFDNAVDPFVATFNPLTFGDVVFNGADPDTFVFLDPVHPTTAVHDIIASAAFGLLEGDGAVALPAVPEPATVGMLILLAIPTLSRRR